MSSNNQDQSDLSVSELCRLAHANSVDQVQLTVLEAHALLNLRRRDWDMRVLDAWRHESPVRSWKMAEVHDQDGPLSSFGCVLSWHEGSKDYAGSTDDAARELAAKAVYPTLVSLATIADLGQRP